MQVAYEKNRDFRPLAHFVSEKIQDRATVTTYNGMILIGTCTYRTQECQFE